MLKLLQDKSISPIPGPSPTWAELELCLAGGQGTHWQQVFLRRLWCCLMSLLRTASLDKRSHLSSHDCKPGPVQAERTVAGGGTSASCPCPFTPLSSRRQPSPVTALKAAVRWHDAQQREGEAAGSPLMATLQGLGRNRKWGNWKEIIQLTLWCKVPKSSEGNANPAQKTSVSFSPILTFA